MYARVTTVQGSAEQLEQGIRMINEIIIPRVSQAQGFKTGYWLADRQAGKVLGVVLWETQADLEASRQLVPQLRAQIQEAIGVNSPPTVEEYEVIAQA